MHIGRKKYADIHTDRQSHAEGMPTDREMNSERQVAIGERLAQ